MVVRERGDAGGVSISLLRQDAVRPGRAGIDREARGAVAFGLRPGGLGDGSVGAAQVRAERFRRQGEDAVMVPPVAGDLVPSIGDAADECGIALCYPAQGEEGALHLCLVEQRQDGIGIALDALGQRVPVAFGDDLLEGADLEPVFHVAGKGIQHSPPSRHPGGSRDLVG